MESQYFDINLPPNGTQRLYVQAEYIRFYEGSAGGADNTIMVQAVGGGGRVLLKPGEAFRCGANTDWLIANYKNQGTILGMLMASDSGFDSGRIAGSVEVIDGGKARTMAGSAFMGGAFCNAVASQYPVAQLWNPTGSGVNLIVEQFNLFSTSAQAGVFAVSAARRANLNQAGQPKKLGGANGKGELRNETLVASYVSNLSLINYSVQLGANAKFSLREPLVIPPGQGVEAYGSSQNVNLGANFEWFEEGI